MNLLALKNKIKTVKNIGQITKAMELVAATKMRKAQLKVTQSRQYTTELKNIISKLASQSSLSHPLFIKNNSDKNLLIIIGPSKALAGPLITNLTKEVIKFTSKNTKTDLITIDKKGLVIGKKTKKSIIFSKDDLPTNVLENEFEEIYKKIKKEYLDSNYAKVSIVYTKYISTLNQKAEIVDLFPIELDIEKSAIKNDQLLIEPSIEEVSQKIIDKYALNKLYVCVLDSIASEYSARMIAMKNANDNANELKRTYTLNYNQSRQAAITQQILEIAGATAAMEEQ